MTPYGPVSGRELEIRFRAVGIFNFEYTKEGTEKLSTGIFSIRS